LGRRYAFQNVQRFFRFNLIGLVGIVFQLAILWILTQLGVGYLAASSAAIMLTVVHNFGWHWVWTWADRMPRLPPAIAFARFFMANGLVSLMSNLALMPLVAGRLGLPPVPSDQIFIVEVRIDETGRVTENCMLRGVGPEVDRRVLDAVRGWRFEPPRLTTAVDSREGRWPAGSAVPIFMTVTVQPKKR